MLKVINYFFNINGSYKDAKPNKNSPEYIRTAVYIYQ